MGAGVAHLLQAGPQRFEIQRGDEVLQGLQRLFEPADAFRGLAGVLLQETEPAASAAEVQRGTVVAASAGSAVRILQNVQRVKAGLLVFLGGLFGGAACLLGVLGEVVGGIRRGADPSGPAGDGFPFFPGSLAAEDRGDGLRHAVCQGGDHGQRVRHGIQSRQEHGTDRPDSLAKLGLDIAERVAQLHHAPGRCRRQSLVHAADALAHDLGEHGGLLSLGAVFEDLFLGLVEVIAVAAQRAGLALHDLAQHGGDRRGLLGGHVIAVLLGGHVVHDRDQRLQALGEAQIGGQLLGSCRLNVGADHAELLLGGGEIQNALDLAVSGAHRVAHDARESDLAFHLSVIGGGRLLGKADDLRDAEADAERAENLPETSGGALHHPAALIDAGGHAAHGRFCLVALLGDGREVSAGTHHQVFYYSGHVFTLPFRRIGRLML